MAHILLATLLLLAAASTLGCAGSAEPPSQTEAGSRAKIKAAASEETGAEGRIEPAVQTAEEKTAQTRSPLSTPTRATQGTKTAEPFVSDSWTSGGAGNEADSILAVRYGEHPGYERVVVGLGVGGRPGRSVPEWTLLSPARDGLLRVTFPSVSATRVSDGPFDGPLPGSYYVVRAPEGGMFVDIFARSAFAYRVLELSDPARLAIDFEATDAKLRRPLPAQSANTVLTEPRRGALASGPLLVSGYSRNPEAQNIIVLQSRGGEVLMRGGISSNDWTSTWGYFETTLDPPPFSGTATLRVGAESARDGSFEGVRVPLRGGP